MTNLFVGFALFFPRLTLLWCWFGNTMPANDTPFWLDVLFAIVAPRLLVGWWLYQEPTWHVMWAVLFVVASLFSGGSSSNGARRAYPKREVTP